MTQKSYIVDFAIAVPIARLSDAPGFEPTSNQPANCVGERLSDVLDVDWPPAPAGTN
jgi:hypothetical protein